MLPPVLQCRRCKGPVTSPKECLGTSTQGNKGEFYQQCEKYWHRGTDSCKFWYWLTGPKAEPQQPSATVEKNAGDLIDLLYNLALANGPLDNVNRCQGLTCAKRIMGAQAADKSCERHLCHHCCRELSIRVRLVGIVLAPCLVDEHALSLPAMVAATSQESLPSDFVGLRTPTRKTQAPARGTSTSKTSTGKTSTSKTITSKTITTQPESTSSTTSTLAGSKVYSRHLDPLITNSLKMRGCHVEGAPNDIPRARDTTEQTKFARLASTEIEIFLWWKDGEGPEIFQFSVKLRRWVHPMEVDLIKHFLLSKNIVLTLSADKLPVYQIYKKVLGTWMTTCNAIQPSQTSRRFFLRVPDVVTHCEGLERWTNMIEPGGTQKRERSESPGRDDDVSEIPPPSSQSTSTSMNSPSPSPTKRPKMMTSRGSGPIGQQAAEPQTEWPPLFVCDMYEGMERLNRLRGARVVLPQGFAQAFPGFYFKPSTVRDNLDKWTIAMTLYPNAMEAARRSGRTSGGYWSTVRSHLTPVPPTVLGTSL